MRGERGERGRRGRGVDDRGSARDCRPQAGERTLELEGRQWKEGRQDRGSCGRSGRPRWGVLHAVCGEAGRSRKQQEGGRKEAGRSRESRPRNLQQSKNATNVSLQAVQALRRLAQAAVAALCCPACPCTFGNRSTQRKHQPPEPGKQPWPVGPLRSQYCSR